MFLFTQSLPQGGFKKERYSWCNLLSTVAPYAHSWKAVSSTLSAAKQGRILFWYDFRQYNCSNLACLIDQVLHNSAPRNLRVTTMPIRSCWQTWRDPFFGSVLVGFAAVQVVYFCLLHAQANPSNISAKLMYLDRRYLASMA